MRFLNDNGIVSLSEVKSLLRKTSGGKKSNKLKNNDSERIQQWCDKKLRDSDNKGYMLDEHYITRNTMTMLEGT